MESEIERRTAIILVDWKGWQDTEECVQSILNARVSVVDIVVVDNDPEVVASARLDAYFCQKMKCQKTVAAAATACYANSTMRNREIQIILIAAQCNHGFAAGCNLGIRWALAHGAEYFWLLNNDTVIDPGALQALKVRSSESNDEAIVGSWVRYRNSPEKTQVYGGSRYCPWLASVHDVQTKEDSLKGYDYIYGAAMFLSRNVVQKVGFLEESLFLYGEELDYACRARGYNIKLAVADDSIVYHRHGGSIGSSLDLRKRSDLSDFYSLRNKVFITKRYYSKARFMVILRLAVSLLVRLRLGEWMKARMAWYAIRLMLGAAWMSYEDWREKTC